MVEDPVPMIVASTVVLVLFHLFMTRALNCSGSAAAAMAQHGEVDGLCDTLRDSKSLLSFALGAIHCVTFVLHGCSRSRVREDANDGEGCPAVLSNALSLPEVSACLL